MLDPGQRCTLAKSGSTSKPQVQTREQHPTNKLGVPINSNCRGALGVSGILISVLPHRRYIDPCTHDTVHGSLSGEGQQPQGGGSGASPPGVLMETKLKALVGKLSAIQSEVCWAEWLRCIGGDALRHCFVLVVLRDSSVLALVTSQYRCPTFSFPGKSPALWCSGPS